MTNMTPGMPVQDTALPLIRSFRKQHRKRIDIRISWLRGKVKERGNLAADFYQAEISALEKLLLDATRWHQYVARENAERAALANAALNSLDSARGEVGRE